MANTGGLVTWGRAQHGQLGHGRKQHPDLPSPTPVAALAGRPLAALACGHFHTAALVASSPAEVHTWGRGALGLLGHGDEEDCLQPRPVRALSGIAIRTVACSVYQTAAVSERGELFSWGWRLERTGGPGAPVVESYSTLPERVYGELHHNEVRRVACGHYCTAAVTSDGALYTWGKGERGQLGHGHVRDVIEPARVGVPSNAFVWDAQCGKHWLLVLTAAGEVCTCGAADGGVLGRPGPSGAHGMPLLGAEGGMASADEMYLRLIPALRGMRVSAIACGETHGACLAGEGGEVYTWGSSAFGKLGYESLDDVSTPTAVPHLGGTRFVEIACGSHSTLALTDGGQLFSWGTHVVGAAAPPARVRMSGAACTIAAGGAHSAAAFGDYPVVSAADLAIARSVGFEPPRTRAALPAGVASEMGSLTALLEARVAPDASPDTVLRELHELRGLLAAEEGKRDVVNSELMELQQQLQQTLVDEEMLRERRGGVEPPPEPSLTKGLALVDKNTYASMLPDEQLEVNLFGFKLAVATRSKASP